MQASYNQTTPRRQRLAGNLSKPHFMAAGVALCLVAAIALIPSNDAVAKRRSTEITLSFTAPKEIKSERTSSGESSNSHTELLPEEAEIALQWQTEQVRNGDNLTSIFKRASLNATDVYNVMSAKQHAKVLTKMLPGQSLRLGFNEQGKLEKLVYEKSRLESYQFTDTEHGFSGEHVVLAPELLPTYRQATIDNSLFLAAEQANMPHNLIMELANIFGWDIDFVFDIRKGDRFAVLYEEKFLDGEKIGTGNILAAEFTNQGKTFSAVRYENSEGIANYYTPEGLSMRKAFLRAPLDVFRISSNFNLRRKHPIHKKIKAHRGVDYAAPRGTPVYAAGNGKVIAAGYSKANGNYVFIQHGQRYVTKYLHLHKRYVRKGQTVAQRKTIGTVGSTGYATGPHLHYEFLVNGVHRNPRTVELPQAKPIAAQELGPFNNATAPLLAQLASYNQNNQLAMVDPQQKQNP
ncbi:MAG: peptidoglycan DD-metalloendopeptidase family protein [Pseudomonadales bacterium]|nr:peptidoglycan DD-metalloendopeptidase family protein [Pseudomonadales bacterium]